MKNLETEATYIDIHTHGGWEDNNPDVVAVVSFSVGKSSSASMQKSFYSVGIYPFDENDMTDAGLEKLEKLVCSDNCFAIGEIGLDYREQYKNSSTVQKAVFEKQVLLANKHLKPTVIHQVRALDDTLGILKIAVTPVIFHGFSGSPQTAKQLTDKGYYLSFGHLLQSNTKIQESLRNTPLDRIFFETDASEFGIEDIYEKAAEILNTPVETLTEQIKQNFEYVRNLARENRPSIR